MNFSTLILGNKSVRRLYVPGAGQACASCGFHGGRPQRHSRLRAYVLLWTEKETFVSMVITRKQVVAQKLMKTCGRSMF